MLYEFLLNYIETFTFLNVFKYITTRTGLAFFTSLLIALLIGGPFIKLFSNRKIFNPIRQDGPSDHIVKKIGTPTMGGIIILLGLVISVLLWADLKNIYILFCLYIVSSFGILGAFGGWPIEGFAFGVLIGDIYMLVFYRQRILKRHPHWLEVAHDLPWAITWHRLVEMFQLSGFLYLQSVSMFVRDLLLRFTITALMGLGAAAVFEIANRVCMLLFNVITAGFTALYPSFSNLRHSDDRKAIWIIFLHAFLILAGMGVWGVVQCFVFVDTFYDVWLGEADEQLITLTRILLIWTTVSTLFVPLWHLVNALGYEKYGFFAVAVHGAGGLALFLLGLPLEWTFIFWVTLGICTYGFLVFAGSEVTHYLKHLLRSRSAMALLFCHLIFGGLVYYVFNSDNFRWVYIYTALDIVYLFTILLVSRHAIKSFVSSAFKNANPQ